MLGGIPFIIFYKQSKELNYILIIVLTLMLFCGSASSLHSGQNNSSQTNTQNQFP